MLERTGQTGQSYTAYRQDTYSHRNASIHHANVTQRPYYAEVAKSVISLLRFARGQPHLRPQKKCAKGAEGPSTTAVEQSSAKK